jgi:hypothetical protein
MEKVNNIGTVGINVIEIGDRGISLEAGLRMAAKKGMTAEQAMYGVLDTILKNNFLGREFTPHWLNNPKTRAAMLFQATPYKILERRLVNAIRAEKPVEKMGKAVWKATKSPEGRQELMQQLKDLKRYVFEGESELKNNLYIDTLRSEVDFFGTTATRQFMRDLITLGAAGYGLSQVGLNMWHHFFHLPFIKASNTGPEMSLALSPALDTITQASYIWDRSVEENESFSTLMIRRWLGPTGPFPDMIWKVNRLSNNDIPEVYRDSKFRYLFSIPATKE